MTVTKHEILVALRCAQRATLQDQWKRLQNICTKVAGECVERTGGWVECVEGPIPGMTVDQPNRFPQVVKEKDDKTP